MNKGTLLELGLLPIITSAFIWQIAAGLRLINVNFKLRIDRELFQTGQKLTSFIFSLIFAIGLIYSGYYDNAIRVIIHYKMVFLMDLMLDFITNYCLVMDCHFIGRNL